MRQLYWEIRGLGVELVAAANEDPKSHADLRDQLDLPFSLLCDDDAELAKALHVFHENEPKNRLIARPAMFLIDTTENDNRILWEHASPTSRHRVPPSRIMEELLTVLGYQHQIVNVVVPSEGELTRLIADLQEPPLGLYRTPNRLTSAARVQREFMEELAMAAHSEIHRLSNHGWQLATVAPEYDGPRPVGQRYVFQRVVELDGNEPSS